MARLALLGMMLCGLSGCGAPATLEARYTGRLAGCGPASAATLTRIGEAVAFAPSDGALVLRGTVTANGAFAGALNTQAAGRPAFMLTVRGNIGPDSATVQYATPRCAATATLARAPSGPL